MYCIYCGAQIDDDSLFCPVCGKSMPHDEPAAANSTQEEPLTGPVEVVETLPQGGAQWPGNPAEAATTAVPVEHTAAWPVPAANDCTPHGESLTQGIVSRVFAELRDNDIMASAAGGEMRCPSSAAQNMFMRLIKRGIIMLFILALPPLTAAAYEKVIPIQFNNGIVSAQGQLVINTKERVTFETPDIFNYDTPSGVSRDYRSKGEILLWKGDTFTMTVTFSDANPGDNYELHSAWANVTTICDGNILKEDIFDKAADSTNESPASGLGTSHTITLSGVIEYNQSEYVANVIRANLWVKAWDKTKAYEDRFFNFSFFTEIESKLAEEGAATYAEDETVAEEAADTTGVHAAIDSSAAENYDGQKDEQRWVIPALIIGGAVVAAGAGVYVARSRRRKKTANNMPDDHSPADGVSAQQEDDNPQDEADNSQDEEDKYTYEMRIRHDCGDTLYPGDPRQVVYVRIVRIDRQGRETTDYALTQRIRITGDDYVEIHGQQMAGEYMGAFILAREIKTPPTEAVVTFTMTAGGGSFSNRMHFNVAQMMIVLAEDELTLPAVLENPVYLPFDVLGMGDEPTVEVTAADKTYTAEVIRRPEDEGIYYAIITERDKKLGTPGHDTFHRFTFRATSREGRAVTTEFYVRRFTMGLVCKGLTRVKCYMEEYDAKRHVFADLHRQVQLDTAQNIGDEPHIVTKTMTPAETRFTLSLYEYNEKDGSIVCIPPTITKYDVIIDDEPPTAGDAVPALSNAGMMVGGMLPPGVGASLGNAANDISAASARYNERADTVRALGFHIDAAKGLEDPDRDPKELICYMVCRGGKLDSPNRLTARIIIEAEHNGRKYYLEHRTLLISQPVRHIAPSLYDEVYNRDKQIKEALERMRSDIYLHHYADLHLLQLLIDTMLDMHSMEYGYDWQMVRGVFRVYNNYLNNQRVIDNLSTDDSATYAAYTVDRILAQSRKMQGALGFFPRLFLGVATLGGSELLFNTLEVVGNMKTYVDKGGDSVLVGWVYGSKVAVREYIWGLAMKYGLAKIKDLLKARAGKLRALSKTDASKQVGRTAEKASKEAAENAAKKASKEAAENAAKKASKEAAESAAEKTSKEAAENAAKKAGKEAAEDAAKKASKEAAENAAEKTSKEISDAAADVSHHAKKVKAAQQKAAARTGQAKREARRLADETRQKMDPETQKLCDAEESGLLAAQDKIDNYRRACELPDTPKYRQKRLDAMMEVQADKNAMSLLGDVDNQTLNPLRKNFNADIKKVHYSTEFDMKSILAEQLEKDPRFKGRKFQVDDIKTFNATKSSSEALQAGSKITMDYDGTFYVHANDGTKIYLDQKQVQEAFTECLYRKAKGGEKASAQVAAEFFEATDHSIVQSDLHPESLGFSNIDTLMSDPVKGLADPERAAKAFTDKCMHWYKNGLELIGMGDKNSIERGVAYIREAFRQCKKQFDNFATVRDAARESINGGSQISDEMYRLVNYLGETDIHKGTLKVGECLKGLEQMGTSPQRIFQELGNTILRIG